MRNNNNNITSGLENIISFSKNITSHFTGKEKIIILAFLIIMLSFVNITSTSALSYQSNVGVGFTFNPTLSVSLSSSDLVIANLVPGNTLDSNIINVSVASNAAYGYTLSAIVNGNNSNLTHTNDTNTFSSIATNADLSDLEDSEDTNIWGYSYKDNTVEAPAWSNYNGLSSNNSTTLINTNSNISSNLDFKIAAKSSNTQAGGTYTSTINFTAVSKHIPVSLAEAYASEGKTMFNGYYTMQDMNSTICSKAEVTDAQLQVIDTRDKKVYWIAKLKDGHCWMTQNLDLDLSHKVPLTSNNTDLTDHSLSGAYVDDYSYDAETGVITWVPSNYAETIDFEGTSVRGWNSSHTGPSSASKTDGTNTGHSSSGNWYSWTAAIASNDSSSFYIGNANNSICPLNWRLPNANNNEFTTLNNLYNNGSTSSDANLVITPLWLTRSGTVDKESLKFFSTNGYYWSATALTSAIARNLRFTSSSVQPNYTGSDYGRNAGFSVRCLAR